MQWPPEMLTPHTHMCSSPTCYFQSRLLLEHLGRQKVGQVCETLMGFQSPYLQLDPTSEVVVNPWVSQWMQDLSLFALELWDATGATSGSSPSSTMSDFHFLIATIKDSGRKIISSAVRHALTVWVTSGHFYTLELRMDPVSTSSLILLGNHERQITNH